MPVDATQSDRAPIDEQLSASDLQLAESDPLRCLFHDTVPGIHELQSQSVEVWCLCCPKFRVIDNDVQSAERMPATLRIPCIHKARLVRWIQYLLGISLRRADLCAIGIVQHSTHAPTTY